MFSEKLRDWLNNNKELQSEIRNQILGWIDKGLEDWCVSRDGPYFGFKIPGEENKYFYVWLDAPIGYISSLSHYTGSIDKGLSYWNDARIIHIIGKDIIYFHLLFWPAVLMGAELKLPENVLVHGFLNVNNEKMSKSRGTFLTAEEFLPLAKPEYLRYYFASNLSRTMTDVNLDLEDFKNRINNELVGNIANFAYRVLSFTNTKLSSEVTSLDESNKAIILQTVNECKSVFELYEKYDLREALKKISVVSASGNKLFQEKEPWKLLKTSQQDEAQQVINVCINILKNIIIVIKPVLPNFAKNLETQLGLKELSYLDLIRLIENHKIGTAEIVFQRIEKIDIN